MLDDGTHLCADTLKERIQTMSYPHFSGVHGVLHVKERNEA